MSLALWMLFCACTDAREETVPRQVHRLGLVMQARTRIKREGSSSQDLDQSKISVSERIRNRRRESRLHDLATEAYGHGGGIPFSSYCRFNVDNLGPWNIESILWCPQRLHNSMVRAKDAVRRFLVAMKATRKVALCMRGAETAGKEPSPGL
jgi:hypothetical protein